MQDEPKDGGRQARQKNKKGERQRRGCHEHHKHSQPASRTIHSRCSTSHRPQSSSFRTKNSKQSASPRSSKTPSVSASRQLHRQDGAEVVGSANSCKMSPKVVAHRHDKKRWGAGSSDAAAMSTHKQSSTRHAPSTRCVAVATAHS